MRTFETELRILETPIYDTTEEREAQESRVLVKRFLDKVFTS